MIQVKNNWIYFLFLGKLFSQSVYTEFVLMDGDTVDTFSYQIPSNYSGTDSVPLLVVFHQWGGNENSSYYTEFDEEANERGWLYLSPYGGSANNYNHQSAQDFVEWAIIWLQNHYLIDSNRIYMVGGSMGGAAGAIFANNHLDPRGPMVAATASGSGILDCERRYYEMDGNNSMIQWFGGTPEEVPFEYHRNSAVYFADTPQSMHFNLQHTPLYLDFGSSEAHRYHAEDLYNLLLGYNENMWIETDPIGGHGFSVMDEHHTCNWMEQYELVDNPLEIDVNLDEPSRAYWAEAVNIIEDDQFIRLKCSRNFNRSFFDLYQFSNSDSIIFHDLFFFNEPSYNLTIENHTPWEIGEFSIGLTGAEIGLIDYISAYGEMDDFLPPLNYSIQDSIIWIHIPEWELQYVHVEIYFGNTTTIEVEHNLGWNLVGLPNYVTDGSAFTLFPESIEGTLFSFNGAYILSDIMIPGTGYWLRFENEGNTVITGYPIPSLELELTEGWNLISGISLSYEVNLIVDPFGIIIPETFFGFDETYFQVDVLDPGKGYWVRAHENGLIHLSTL
jgi:pimeloyl-ACP methyl ester carboxylesterase